MGVVVRRYIDILIILLIPILYSTCIIIIALFAAASLLCSFKKNKNKNIFFITIASSHCTQITLYAHPHLYIPRYIYILYICLENYQHFFLFLFALLSTLIIFLSVCGCLVFGIGSEIARTHRTATTVNAATLCPISSVLSL